MYHQLRLSNSSCLYFAESSRSPVPMQGSRARRARRILERTVPRRPPSSRGLTGRRRPPPPPRCQRPPNPAARGKGAETGRRCCQVYLCDNLRRIRSSFLWDKIFPLPFNINKKVPNLIIFHGMQLPVKCPVASWSSRARLPRKIRP